MTSLSDFGGGIDESEAQPPSRATVYSTGRCIAIVGERGDIRRCQNDAKRGRDCCHQHLDQENQLTIYSGPRALIKKDGIRSGNCRAVKGDGERCSYTTPATEILCTTHERVDDPELVTPDDDELHQERIQEALNAVEEQLSKV